MMNWWTFHWNSWYLSSKFQKISAELGDFVKLVVQTTEHFSKIQLLVISLIPEFTVESLLQVRNSGNIIGEIWNNLADFVSWCWSSLSESFASGSMHSLSVSVACRSECSSLTWMAWAPGAYSSHDFLLDFFQIAPQSRRAEKRRSMIPHEKGDTLVNLRKRANDCRNLKIH